MAIAEVEAKDIRVGGFVKRRFIAAWTARQVVSLAWGTALTSAPFPHGANRHADASGDLAVIQARVRQQASFIYSCFRVHGTTISSTTDNPALSIVAAPGRDQGVWLTTWPAIRPD
jgi:hypothetical protein